jgi:aminoglycoside phosphotransferase (APT) family kinase protein
MTVSYNHDAMASRLERVAARLANGECSLAGLRRLSGGAIQETWRFSVEQGAVRKDYVLRRQADSTVLPGAAVRAGLAAEAKLLPLAAAYGVPVAKVCTVLCPEDGLGEGFVMEFIEGETLGGRIARDDRYRAARAALTHQCGAAMAAIHRMPVDALPALRRPAIRELLDSYEETYRSAGDRKPVFELALKWLREHMPAEPAQACLVHGDFRNGNLMVGEEGLRALLDWELAHLGDPMEDLGWICVSSWRFGGTLPVGGFGRREDLFASYRSAGGTVDDARVRFWETFGVLKWGISCQTISRPAEPGGIRSVEQAVIGRRSSEAEIDLLELLAPRQGVT